MRQVDEIMDVVMTRNLGENLQDLIQLSKPNNHYKLNLIKYNTCLANWFKGLLTQEEFKTETLKLWDSLFFFLDREKPETLEQFSRRLGVTLANGKITVLYVAAIPKGVVPLEIDAEYQKIRDAIQIGVHREGIELLRPVLAATLENFVSEKNKVHPTIIHFSGHGTGTSLVFSSGTNTYRLVEEPVLKEVFRGVNQYAKCIVLNACYAASQAKTISEEDVFVIGMNAPITDSAALFLSEKFYRALSDGLSVDEAFYQTRLLMLAEFPKQGQTPELWKGGQNITERPAS